MSRKASRRWIVVLVVACIVATWVLARSLPPWAEGMFIDDLDHADKSPWRAHRALRFDRHRAATDQWQQLARLLDHPDKDVRNRAARVVANVDTPVAFETMTAAWERGTFDAKDFRARLRRMNNPMQLRQAREFVANGRRANELELKDWLAELEATHVKFFGDARLNEALAAFNAAVDARSSQ